MPFVGQQPGRPGRRVEVGYSRHCQQFGLGQFFAASRQLGNLRLPRSRVDQDFVAAGGHGKTCIQGCRQLGRLEAHHRSGNEHDMMTDTYGLGLDGIAGAGLVLGIDRLIPAGPPNIGFCKAQD